MASLVHVYGKSVLCRFLAVCVNTIYLIYFTIVERFQELNLEVCMGSNNGAKICHATKCCFPRTQKERQTKDDLIPFVHKLPISKLESNIILHVTMVIQCTSKDIA